MDKIDIDVAQSFINILFHKKKDVQFIHVGVNDAINSDFVRWRALSFNWTGLCIEPHPIYFKMAQQNYQESKNISWENVAVSESHGYADLFFIKNIPIDKDWALGIASFEKNHLIKLGFPEDNIDSINVNFVPLQFLIEKYNLFEIDLLVVDVEGHEFEVFKSIDFSNFSVSLVVLETTHMTRFEFNQILELFPNNYRGFYIPGNADSIIYKQNY